MKKNSSWFGNELLPILSDAYNDKVNIMDKKKLSDYLKKIKEFSVAKWIEQASEADMQNAFKLVKKMGSVASMKSESIIRDVVSHE